MLAVDIIAVATALVSLFSAAIASSCCSYICSRNDTVTIELLKVKKQKLVDLISELKRKHNGEAVLTVEQSSFMSTAAAFLAEENESIEKLEGAIDEKCVCGLLHNPCAQNQARSKMKDKSLELDHLIQEAENMTGTIVRGYRQSRVVAILGNKRKVAVDEIWRLVSATDGPEKLICIHGTFGVGKTAIAASIHNQALIEPDLFDYIIWVTVEDGTDLWQVQDKFAKRLEIELPCTSDVVEGASNHRARNITIERAEKLKEALSDKQKFLIVLDSMWKPLSLEEIGIPELVNGRKLIVTSRISTVCNTINKFEIQPLPTEEEAWELFQEEMGEFLEHLNPETDHAAIKRELLAELDGLPLAISKFAQRLKKNNLVDLSRKWRRELDYLAKKRVYREGTDLELFTRFTASYKNLEEKTRQCFLYCALFPKGHLIDSKELIEYWMWEGLLGVNNADRTLEEAREEGAAILEEISNAHLLEDTSTGTSDAGNFLKILSLVHNMAIDTIVKEEKQVCIRSGGSLACLPSSGSDWNSNVERASFMKNQLKLLDVKGNLNCNQLSTLLLQDNPLDLGVENYFFSSAPNLKVLDMSRTNISTLPKSLSKLGNLRALPLRNCANLTGLPNLSYLQQLIVLDLTGTPLQNCPLGIRNMKKLRRLNLSQTKIATFPPNVVDKLVELEELLMITDHNCVWGSSEDEKWKGACIQDLVKVQNLALLQLHFRNAKAFDKYVNTAKDYTQVPPKFRFRVGDVTAGGTVKGNSLAISGLSIDSGTFAANKTPESSQSKLNGIVLQKLRDLNVLDVSNFSGLSSLLSAEVLGSLTQLKELRVQSCKDMVEVIVLKTAEEQQQQQPSISRLEQGLQAVEEKGKIHLPELTRMELFDLPNLESVCCRQVLLDFPKLASVNVRNCDNLKIPMIDSRGETIEFTLAEESETEELIAATNREELQGGGDGLVGATRDWFWSLMDGPGNNIPPGSSNAQQTEIKVPATPTDQAEPKFTSVEEPVPPELITASTSWPL